MSKKTLAKDMVFLNMEVFIKNKEKLHKRYKDIANETGISLYTIQNISHLGKINKTDFYKLCEYFNLSEDELTNKAEQNRVVKHSGSTDATKVAINSELLKSAIIAYKNEHGFRTMVEVERELSVKIGKSQSYISFSLANGTMNSAALSKLCKILNIGTQQIIIRDMLQPQFKSYELKVDLDGQEQTVIARTKADENYRNALVAKYIKEIEYRVARLKELL